MSAYLCHTGRWPSPPSLHFPALRQEAMRDLWNGHILYTPPRSHLQPQRCIGLDSRLKLRETLVIGVQTFQIRIMHRLEQDFGGRHRTSLPQRRIDDGIERNQDIELRERD